MKRIATVVLVAGSMLGIAAPAALADSGSACIHLSVNVNGQGQTIDQCLPSLPSAPSLPGN